MKILKILWYIIFMLFLSEEAEVSNEPFPVILQKSEMECGPTCLQMISKYYGVDYEIETLNKLSNLGANGTSMGAIGETGELIGLHNLAVSFNYETLLNEVPYPAMLYWKSSHFIVVYNVSKDSVWVADPAFGLITYSKEEFIPAWTDSSSYEEEEEGYALIFETTDSFYDEKTKRNAIKKANNKK